MAAVHLEVVGEASGEVDTALREADIEVLSEDEAEEVMRRIEVPWLAGCRESSMENKQGNRNWGWSAFVECSQEFRRREILSWKSTSTVQQS